MSVVLSKQDLREVTAFAAGCAEVVLAIFEADQPDDSRPRDAVGAAWEFARGGERGKVLRDTAWAALRAAKAAETAAACEAAMAAASAAYCIRWPRPPRSNTFSVRVPERPSGRTRRR
ncbi:putative immunity protein [Actinophytocola sp.]|uniref:putative immunity protein n=1 Tax=Actinophytocola sp. TaxID=1872138 RepID=UPI002ED35F06